MLYQIYMFGACMNGFTHSSLVAWTVFSKVLGGYTQPHSSVGPSAPNAWTHAACSSLQHLKGSPARRDVTSSCLTDMPICTTFFHNHNNKKANVNKQPQTTNNKQQNTTTTTTKTTTTTTNNKQQTTTNNKQQPTNNNEPPPPASPSSTTTATTTTVTKCKWKRANSDVCNKHGLHWPTTQERCGAIGGWTGGVRRHSHSFCYNVVRSHSAFSP